jgi:hypothetical protein
MKKLISCIGLLVLAGCSAANAASVSSWGTPYVTDNLKVAFSELTLRNCVQKAIDTEYYGLDRTRIEVQGCYEEEVKNSKVPGTDTYYFWEGQEKNGESPFADFELCINQIASSISEFGPDDTTFTYRTELRNCLRKYPGDLSGTHEDAEARLLKHGDKLRVLLMDRGVEQLLDCDWLPIATGYAEDARCTFAPAHS